MPTRTCQPIEPTDEWQQLRLLTSSYVDHQSGIDSTVRHGWNYYWKSTYLPELSDELVNVISKHAFACSSPRSYAALFHLGGAVGRVSEGDTAFGNRQVSHAITLDAVWQPGEDYGDQDIAWTRGFFAALDRFRDGVYVNFLGADECPAGFARRTVTPSITGWRA